MESQELAPKRPTYQAWRTKTGGRIDFFIGAGVTDAKSLGWVTYWTEDGDRGWEAHGSLIGYLESIYLNACAQFGIDDGELTEEEAHRVIFASEVGR